MYWRVPQRMNLAARDQVQAAQVRLVHRRQQHAGQHHADQDLVMVVQDRFAKALPRQLLDHRRRELEGQHRHVGHDADAHIEQNRAVVPHHDGMPEAPRQADLVQVADAHGQIAEERNQNGGAQDRPVALHAQQVNRGADAEARSRQIPRRTAYPDPTHRPHGIWSLRFVLARNPSKKPMYVA